MEFLDRIILRVCTGLIDFGFNLSVLFSYIQFIILVALVLAATITVGYFTVMHLFYS